MARIDYTAVAAAAGGGLAVILPGAVLSGLLAPSAGDWIVWVSLIVILIGFAVSGLVAGRLCNDTPMAHGGLGGGGAFVGALVVGLVVAAGRDRSISIVAVALAAVAAVTAGVGGALLADVLNRRTNRRALAGGGSRDPSGRQGASVHGPGESAG